MMLDAQMIDQLIQRQDVEDRKRLLMLGLDKTTTTSKLGKTQKRAQSTLE